MKENREEVLLMVPVVCDFSSWVLFSPLSMLVAHKKSISGVGFTHNISISHFCEGLFSIG